MCKLDGMNTRLRRLRQSAGLRSLVTETTLAPCNLVYPLFVCEGQGVSRAVDSMPGISNLSVDNMLRHMEPVADKGLGGVILFGIPETKDATGTSGTRDDGIVQTAVRALKREFPQMTVITDVCLCEYTDHGHCGVLNEQGDILNDETVERLESMAVSHARAGADMVAPSDMMDMRVAGIRRALDADGFVNLPIMSYAVKYASAFYGPFRDALDSAPKSGDKKTYQMDPANLREVEREVRLDEAEGADILMVKPGLPYADVIARVRQLSALPVAVYHVSGEYTMLKLAAERGYLDYERCLMESLMCLRRAGADIIFTYGALDAARLLAAQK